MFDPKQLEVENYTASQSLGIVVSRLGSLRSSLVDFELSSVTKELRFLIYISMGAMDT